jgi:hypothetical protein
MLRYLEVDVDRICSLRNFLLACLAMGAVWTTGGAIAAPACPRLEIAIVDDQGTRLITGPDGKVLHLNRAPILSMVDFTGANVTLTEGEIVLNLNLSREGGLRIQQFSKDHVGTTMAFIQDGEVIKTAKIVDPILGDGILVGPFDRAKADALADVINTRSGNADHSDAGCARTR